MRQSPQTKVHPSDAGAEGAPGGPREEEWFGEGGSESSEVKVLESSVVKRTPTKVGYAGGGKICVCADTNFVLRGGRLCHGVGVPLRRVGETRTRQVCEESRFTE